MLSLREQVELLEIDLKADPVRIAAYSDFPFAIFRYAPGDEWEMRREMRLLSVRLNQEGKRVHSWSMAELLWQSLEGADDFAALVELEKERGFRAAEAQASTYLTDDDFLPIHALLAKRYEGLHPASDVVFLWRLGALAPNLLRVSGLLERLHSMRAPVVPTVVFYPGSWQHTLSFMNLRQPDEPLGSYRVKVYGRE